jgi:hypothetical protein
VSFVTNTENQEIMTNPVPLPIHFKGVGRSYSQIGRKGNVALYSVYSDYFIPPDYALPYVLIGFELITIRVINGIERYPAPDQFGHCAWSIPKSFARSCIALSRRCVSRWRLRMWKTSQTVPDRSTSSGVLAHLACQAAPSCQAHAKQATNWPQRRVTLLKGQM